jgi:hypothetical protein
MICKSVNKAVRVVDAAITIVAISNTNADIVIQRV